MENKIFQQTNPIDRCFVETKRKKRNVSLINMILFLLFKHNKAERRSTNKIKQNKYNLRGKLYT